MNETGFPQEGNDVRPLVARPVTSRAAWIFGGFAAIAALGLFAALEARRSNVSSPATSMTPTFNSGMITSPPEINVPYDREAFAPEPSTWSTPGIYQPSDASAVSRAPNKRTRSAFSQPPMPSQYYPRTQPAQPSGPAIVYQAPPQRPDSGADGATAKSGERVQASMFENPSTTVPKGAVIQAVLETALDSTRAGSARALVSRDVRSFDGTKVLIPRGSRLYGEYKADLSAGQNRAMIQWLRLMRPDGAVIALDSPSADPLGRAGVKGRVNSHFLERFSGMILQSSLDVGVQLATRSVSNGTVVVGLPGSTQSLVTPAPESIRPTLKVQQGMQVSVFVSRDLDFTRVEQ